MSKHCSFFARFAVVACLLALLGLPMWGQTFYGSIVGTVNDASNAAMQGASVALTNVGTGERRTVTTGSDGSYRFVNLVPGNYKVDVEQTGFKRYTRDQIAVNVEAVVRIDVAMQVGDVNQTVEVTAVEGVGKLLVRLDDRMLDLDKPVTVAHAGKSVFTGTPPRTIAVMARTLAGRGDPKLIFDAEVAVDLPPGK